MPNVRWLLALITRVHRWLYRKSRGRIGASLGGSKMLLLEHVGRRSDRLWAKLLTSYSFYDDYRRRTKREIPVVILERA
ncbi:MAG: hypothetical protein ABFS46_16205 [Myxococcota bacterium]